MSPTARSLAEARKRGWRAGVVERWIDACKQRFDLFGFVDLVVLDGKPGVLGLQATSGDNVSARVRKICENEHVGEWLRAGNRVEVWGWSKKGKAGKRKLWDLRIVAVEAGDLASQAVLL